MQPAGMASIAAGLGVLLDPGAVFLNPAAQQALGLQPGDLLRVQSGLGLVTLEVAGGCAVPRLGLTVVRPHMVDELAHGADGVAGILRQPRVDSALDCPALWVAQSFPLRVSGWKHIDVGG